METKSHELSADIIDLNGLVEEVAQTVTAEIVGRDLSSEEVAHIARCVDAEVRRVVNSRQGQIFGSSVYEGRQESQRGKLTPPQLARLWGISPDKVLTWIRSGQLRAVNVATHRGGRPRYLIDAEDVEVFEKKRQVTADLPVRRGRRACDDEIEYFR